MRIFIVAVFSLLVINPASAQTKGKLKRGWINTFLTVQADYHLNNDDIDSSRFMKSSNRAGGQFGLSMVRMTRHRVILAPSIGIKVAQQKLAIDFPLSNTGYNISGSYSDEMTFTNVNLQLKFQGGYSFLMNDKSALEMCTGLIFDFPLSGDYQETLIYEEGLDPQYRELIAFKRMAWGRQKSAANTNTLFPVNALFDFSIDYRFLEGALFKGRSAKIGLNICTLVGGNFNNRTDVTFFGKDRARLGRETFNDRQLSAGLSFSIEL